MLPIVRPFDNPYEAWTSRDATPDEMLASMQAGRFSLTVDDKLTARVTNERQAAEYMAACGVDNGLEGHIDRALAVDPGFQQWLRAMPGATPFALEAYQHEYPPADFGQVDLAIRNHGVALSPGQLLFHGGHIGFPSNGTLVTARPLSTTFCPQVALRQAEWRGKAYDADLVCLYLLHVIAPDTEAFVFDPNASDKGHEKEVLFASGTTLNLRAETAVRNDYIVHRLKDMRMEMESKPVTFYVCEVDVC
ncbi:hypothetical protein SB781_27735 [Paraburkholderia sp. SIMBA_061]